MFVIIKMNDITWIWGEIKRDYWETNFGFVKLVCLTCRSLQTNRMSCSSAEEREGNVSHSSSWSLPFISLVSLSMKFPRKVNYLRQSRLRKKILPLLPSPHLKLHHIWRKKGMTDGRCHPNHLKCKRDFISFSLTLTIIVLHSLLTHFQKGLVDFPTILSSIQLRLLFPLFFLLPLHPLLFL